VNPVPDIRVKGDDQQRRESMKAMYRMAAQSAVVFSTFAVVGMVGSGTAQAAASNGGPNDAYCLNDIESGSPWCGYATFSQCEQSAAGTGADCVANVFGERDRRIHKHSSVIR
jgi:hypothetical protein